MYRKGSLLLLVILIMFGNMSFGASNYPITSDQIIIAEPVRERINNDKSVYLTVNMTNVKITDNPLIVSLVKINNKLSFADELGNDLNVSVMKLSSTAVNEFDRISPYNISYDTDATTYSESFKKETRLINRFFELKDMIYSYNNAIVNLNKVYRFDLIVGNSEAIMKLSSDIYDDYLKWSNLKYNLSEYKKEYSQIQVQYLKLFEKQIITDEFNSMSYFKEVGKLNNGLYKLRFIDNHQQLIKEFTFEVVDREKSLRIIENFNITN